MNRRAVLPLIAFALGCSSTTRTYDGLEPGWHAVTTSRYSSRSEPAQRTPLNSDKLLANDYVKIGELRYVSETTVNEAEVMSELAVRAAGQGAELYSFFQYQDKARVTEKTTDLVDYSSPNYLGQATFTYHTRIKEYETRLVKFVADLYRHDPEAAVKVRAAAETHRLAWKLYDEAKGLLADTAKLEATLAGIGTPSPLMRQRLSDLIRRELKTVPADSVRALLKAGADTDNEYGWVIREAVQAGRADIVRLLIDAGAKHDLKYPPYKNTLAQIAADEGHRAVLEVLAEKGADVRHLASRAAGRGSADLVHYTLRQHPESERRALASHALGAYPVIRDGNGDKKKGNLAVIPVLLGYGADPNARNYEETPALAQAASARSLPAVQLLLEAGADPNLKSKRGIAIIQFTEDPEILKALLARGAVPGPFTLVRATTSGDIDLMGRVVTAMPAKSRVEAASRSLGLAKSRKAFDVLLAAGADLNGRTDNGYTPIIWAGLEGAADVTRWLIEAKADVNACGDYNETALYWAARSGSVETVKILLEAGADPNIVKKPRSSSDERETVLGGIRFYSRLGPQGEPYKRIEELLKAKGGVYSK